MNNSFTILLMIFCHIVDDYYLQGWLASAKQKEWWQKNAPDKLYAGDYAWALLMHGFSWTFMIMLPIAYLYSFEINALFGSVFAFNITIHSIVDDLKANEKLINLWLDQIIHIIQILVTAIVLLPR